MALVKCIECSNQISTSASTCPQCGAKVRRTSTRRKPIVGLLVIGFLGLVLAKNSYTPPVASQPAAAANAVALAAAATGGLSAEQIKSQRVTKAAKLGRDQVPPKPKNDVAPRAQAPSDAQIEAAISDSDDFATHRDAFMSASRKLILEKRCTLAQLKEYGGWVKSQNYKSRPVYFRYCGASHVDNRIYLDVATGEIFQ